MATQRIERADSRESDEWIRASRYCGSCGVAKSLKFFERDGRRDNRVCCECWWRLTAGHSHIDD